MMVDHIFIYPNIELKLHMFINMFYFISHIKSYETI